MSATSTHRPRASDLDARELARRVRDARQRTLAILDEPELAAPDVPYLPILNPFDWEIGHVGWFQERFALREAHGLPPLVADGDALYDSSRVSHERRWDQSRPSLPELRERLERVRDAVLERLERGEPEPEANWLVQLSVAHEDMHQEALLSYRQALGLRGPGLGDAPRTPRAAAGSPDDGDVAGGAAEAGAAAAAGDVAGAGARDAVSDAAGDAEIPGGTFLLGAPDDGRFAHDNERGAHEVELEGFRIARRAVTQGEMRAFVEDGGYRRDELWSPAGRAWRRATGAVHPVYWRREGGTWLRRRFDEWVELEEELAMVHACWHEAEAWCRWAGRRLPTEVEWEAAASLGGSGAASSGAKRSWPWGEKAASPERASLDAERGDVVAAGALSAGDSALGCRQLVGNTWEWTASVFRPYPGFTPDPYRDYSAPWFGSRRVLRGGSWATRARCVRPTWRNYFTPDRRDVFAGFRTCALERGAGPEPSR